MTTQHPVRDNICRHCSHVVDLHYCPNCGEKLMTQRYTLKSVIIEPVKDFIRFEKRNLPKTIWELTVKPGRIIRELIDGHRAALYPPDRYLLLIGAITTALTIRYKFFANEFTSADSDHAQAILAFVGLHTEKDFFNAFFMYAEEYATILNLITLPIFTFFSWLFFHRSGYNLGENLILNMYITAQQLLFLMLLIPLIELFDHRPDFPELKTTFFSAYSALVFWYNIWVYVTFFRGNIFKALILSLLAVFCAYVIQFVVNVGLFGLIGPLMPYLEKIVI